MAALGSQQYDDNSCSGLSNLFVIDKKLFCKYFKLDPKIHRVLKAARGSDFISREQSSQTAVQ